MTILRSISIADGPNLDAFARLRVSEPRLLLDLKRVGSTPDTLATNAVSGSGAVAYSADRASTRLTVGTAVGTAIRQTKARAIYQPGKSLLTLATFVASANTANFRFRVGYFDANNGIFFERAGSALAIVMRSKASGSVVDTSIAQASWNLDKLDGTGKSALTLDVTKTNIVIVDLEWLGVGRVRVGFVINGIPVYCHEFLNANNQTTVYMSNPNLPVRWEAEATGTMGASGYLDAICCMVSSEGGYDINGVTASTDTGATANAIAATSFEEVLALRIKSSFAEFSTAFLTAVASLCTTSSNGYRIRVVLNPTETGAGTWSDVNADSIMEKNTTRTVTEDTGLQLGTDYVSGDGNSSDLDLRPVLTMGQTLAGVGDVLSIQIRSFSGQSEDFRASASWREVY